jgi:anti-sigma factor RsiW
MGAMTDSAEPGWTIRCQYLVELVTDYLDGALDEATRVEFEAHLQLCPGCAEYVRQIETTLRAVGSVPLETLPTQTQAGLIEAFRTFGHKPD